MLSLYNINVFFIGKPKSRPCIEFLEIGFQQDSAFGFFGLRKKVGKGGFVQRRRNLYQNWCKRQGRPVFCYLKSKRRT
jgi:hypothetical protein